MRGSTLAAIGGAALFASACGVQEGDYRVYRVALSSLTQSPSCFPDEMVPDNLAEDVNTFRESVTMVVFRGAGDRLLLDFNGIGFQGESRGGGFTFVAETVDVAWVGTTQRDVGQVGITTNTLELDQSGDAVEGTVTAVTNNTCVFVDAVPDGNCNPPPPCTQSIEFAGVELDDVDVKSSIELTNPVPPVASPEDGDNF